MPLEMIESQKTACRQVGRKLSAEKVTALACRVYANIADEVSPEQAATMTLPEVLGLLNTRLRAEEQEMVLTAARHQQVTEAIQAELWIRGQVAGELRSRMITACGALTGVYGTAETEALLGLRSIPRHPEALAESGQRLFRRLIDMETEMPPPRVEGAHVEPVALAESLEIPLLALEQSLHALTCLRARAEVTKSARDTTLASVKALLGPADRLHRALSDLAEI